MLFRSGGSDEAPHDEDGMRERAEDLERQLAALKRENAELRKDAERLDYIEQQSDSDFIISLVRDWTFNGHRYPDGMRAAIDEAMKK